MGFWDTAGKVAQGALNAIEEKGAEIQSIKMRYEDKSSCLYIYSSQVKDIVCSGLIQQDTFLRDY